MTSDADKMLGKALRNFRDDASLNGLIMRALLAATATALVLLLLGCGGADLGLGNWNPWESL